MFSIVSVSNALAAPFTTGWEKADLQPEDGKTPNHVAVDETVIHRNDQRFCLYAAVDPETNEFPHVRHFPTRTIVLTTQFLQELQEKDDVVDSVFLVDGAPWLQAALFEEHLRFQHVTHGNRNAVEHIFKEVKRRTKQFANHFRNASAESAETWLQTFAFAWNQLICTIPPEGRDITDLQERTQALERERDRLGEFEDVSSHDLQTPLNVANGRLELAREECDSEHLDVIDEALSRITCLTEDVLWLARAGRDIGDVEPVDLRDSVESTWSLVADDASQAGLRYGTGDRPLGRNEADDNRLSQLLENLFENAIEHGGADVTVTVGALDDGFCIEDDGPGIPEDERETVFKSGYSAGGDGTGFGLSIVEQIVEAHGWEIAITEGSDSVARFELTGIEFAAG